MNSGGCGTGKVGFGSMEVVGQGAGVRGPCGLCRTAFKIGGKCLIERWRNWLCISEQENLIKTTGRFGRSDDGTGFTFPF